MAGALLPVIARELRRKAVIDCSGYFARAGVPRLTLVARRPAASQVHRFYVDNRIGTAIPVP